MFSKIVVFSDEQLTAPRQTPKLEDHPFWAVCDYLINIFAANLCAGGRFSIRNLKTPHAVGQGPTYHGVSINAALNMFVRRKIFRVATSPSLYFISLWK